MARWQDVMDICCDLLPSSSFAVGKARTRKKEFVELLDFGTPTADKPSSEVLILYGEGATPSKDEEVLEAREALENCDVLSVLASRNRNN